MKDNPLFEMVMREASQLDVPAMAVHHRRMFVEIWETRGESLDPGRAAEIEKAYAAKLTAELPTAACRAWLIEHHGEIVASGAISIASFAPNPMDLSPKVAYLHSMFTEKAYRGRKCAERIVTTIIEHCKIHGIRRIMLNASDAGRPVYHKLGFAAAADTMRRFVA